MTETWLDVSRRLTAIQHESYVLIVRENCAETWFYGVLYKVWPKADLKLVG